MIIIGTKLEIEAMVAKSCPYMIEKDENCYGDCPSCWKKRVSIVIVRPEQIGTVEKDIDGVSFLERLKEGEAE